MEIKKIIIEHNDGDFTRKGTGDILLANLRIRGGPGIVAHFDVPCLKELVGIIPERLEVYLKKPVELESDRSRKEQERAFRIGRMNLEKKRGWSIDWEKALAYVAQMHLLDLNITSLDEAKKFTQMLDKYRNEIKDQDERWLDACKKKEEEIGQLKMLALNLNEVSDILKKYPDVEDQEWMEAVIKKVLDEALPLEEQLYGEKAVKEQVEIMKEGIEEAGREKTRKYRRR